MTKTLKLAAVALNTRVGDMAYNVAKGKAAYTDAVAKGAEFVMFSELFISGYPPKDNLRRTDFIRTCMRAAEELAAHVGDIPLGFGTPWLAETFGAYGQKATNRYVVAQNGRIVFSTDKRFPAQGGVFDEWRVHVPGDPKVFAYEGWRIGFPICEDIWHDEVVDALAPLVDVFLVPNGSPTYVGKPAVRHRIVANHVRRTDKPMLYLNQVGGQDEHVFDGGAFFGRPGSWSTTPMIEVFSPYWEEHCGMVTLRQQVDRNMFTMQDGEEPVCMPDDMDFMRDGLVLSLRDYLLKTQGHLKVTIGISGGVDSAVVLGLAVLACGKENVTAISLPSKHNTGTTKGFAQQVCDNFGVPLKWWPLADGVDWYMKEFNTTFDMPLKAAGNTAYENLQSRTRGTILMALSNRLGGMLLSTGNKSEVAEGYATLYGDMNGGFNPLKTVYKTQVYRLGFAINTKMGFEAIPAALIWQAPSAELDDDQFDENTLPPYPVLDAILMAFMDEERDVEEIVEWFSQVRLGAPFVVMQHGDTLTSGWDLSPRSFDMREKPPMQQWVKATHQIDRDCYDVIYLISLELVKAVVQRYMLNRFKRYQACPGTTITKASFDDGEKFPIANGWRG